MLIMCAVVLMAAAEIISAIRKTEAKQLPFDFQSAEALHELKEVNARLVKVQLALERLEPQRMG